jgi:AcrR family transcriptional regulator
MQRLDEGKRRVILQVAGSHFAARPYHEVKLDQIAAEARLGKGTLYLYFKSKEDLYVGLILDGVETLLRKLQSRTTDLSEGGVWEQIEGVVEELLAFGRGFPHLYELMRSGAAAADPRLEAKRAEIADLCTRVIRRGVHSGELSDSHPELTAQYLLSFVRVALLYSPPTLDVATLRTHILQVLRRGIQGGSLLEP